MHFFKTTFLFAVAGFFYLTNALDLNNLENSFKDILKDNQGELCLDGACVGLAGNQKGYIAMIQGKHLSNVADNKSYNKHVAKHGVACFNGACAGINGAEPFISYLADENGDNKSEKTEDILKIKGDNGFICLEDACIHLMGSVEDTTTVLDNLKKNGVAAEYAEIISVCSDNKCADIPNFLSGDDE